MCWQGRRRRPTLTYANEFYWWKKRQPSYDLRDLTSKLVFQEADNGKPPGFALRQLYTGLWGVFTGLGRHVCTTTWIPNYVLEILHLVARSRCVARSKAIRAHFLSDQPLSFEAPTQLREEWSLSNWVLAITNGSRKTQDRFALPATTERMFPHGQPSSRLSRKYCCSFPVTLTRARSRN